MRIRPVFGKAAVGTSRLAWGLLAMVLVVGSCVPDGTLGCGDGAGCPDGERCVLSATDDPGMCLPTCDTSQSCAAAAPVCDLQQNVCRSCFPGEDAACQKRDPATPRCGGGHCVQCLSKRSDSAQATECLGIGRGTPVCDKEKNTCRPCQRHSECDSGVCAKDNTGVSLGNPQGSCVPVEQVMIVDQNLCTSDGPVFCTVKQALDRIDAQHRYVLLRKSAVTGDFTDLQIGYLPSHQLPTAPLWLIGPTADTAPANVSSVPPVSLGGLTTKDALTITSSRVTIEGLVIRGSNTGIACLGPGAQVRVVRSLLAGNNTALVAASGCSLSVEQSWLGRAPDGSAFGGAASLTRNARGLDVTASDFWVQNSVFADNGDSRVDGFGGVRVRSLSIGSRSRSGIVNSTFMQQSGLIKDGKYYAGVLCHESTSERLVVMNTLFFTDSPLRLTPEDHYIDPTCGASLHHNGSNDAILTDDKSLVLPATAMPFVAAAARNLHLGPKLVVGNSSLYDGGAAALDLGADRIVAPAIDMDGLVRGATVSIGAYAAVP